MQHKIIFFTLIILIFQNFILNGFEIDVKSKERLNLGRESLETIKTNSKTSRCWEECMDVLSSGCKDMNDVSRSRLAVKLANCHLGKSGFQTYQCSFDMSIPDCTSKMDQISFTTYTNFYIATENICYYLQSEIFQQKTEDTINNLSQSHFEALSTMNQINSKAQYLSNTLDQTYQEQQKLANLQSNLKINLDDTNQKVSKIQSESFQIVESIIESNEKQKQIINSQDHLMKQQKQSTESSLNLMNQIKQSADSITSNSQISIDQQNKLIHLQSEAIDGINVIGRFIDASTSKIKELLNYQEQILSSHQIIFDILNHIDNIQSLILNQFHNFQSIFYYSFLFLIYYFLTSNKRSSSSRLPLFIGLVVNVLIEHYITFNFQPNNVIFPNLIEYFQLNSDQLESTFLLKSKIRQIFIIYSVIIFTTCIYFYRDYEKLNHQLLLNIRNQNNKILDIIKNQQTYNSNQSCINNNQNKLKTNEPIVLDIDDSDTFSSSQ